MTAFIDEVSPPCEEYDRWHIGISEMAEDYLGVAVFAKLPQYFTGIPEVTDLEWEDREIFSFVTTASDLHRIRCQFYERFLGAAKDAHEGGFAK